MLNKKPVNYLNNKDILKEIHESKNTYCSYTSDIYNKYDLILEAYTEVQDYPNSLHERVTNLLLNDEIINRAKENRASRLSQETNTKVEVTDVKTSDLVFRVMTWDHVPVAPKQPRKTNKKKSAKDLFEFEEENIEEIFADLEDDTTKAEVDDMVHVKVNFPPFQHFNIDEYNNVICVGKSHWKGDVVNGEFCKDHGTITNKLAKMYIMLCDKYAMKFNWRGYTYNDEMKASAILQLTYVGLRFNEAKSQNPFAYYTAAITNSFCRVLNTEKRNQNIRDDILEINNLNPSWTRQGSSSGTYEE